MISVIVPIYNCERELKKCIESLINQTHKNLEIILINDGSTDNSYSICEEYASIDDRIVVINNENHGVSYSRNYGINVAKGNYVTFVDADDYLEKDCYESLIKYLDDDIDFVRYNLKDIPNRNFNNLYELKNKKENINDIFDDLLMHFFTSNQNIPCFSCLLLIKKEVAKKIKYNENLKIMEDADFYLSLFRNSKIGLFLDEKKYNYYINSNSAMHNPEYFERNIFCILDSNMSIVNQLLSLNTKKEIIDMVNCTHLDKVLNYFINLYSNDKYSNDKVSCKKTLKRIKNNDRFKQICNNSNNLSLKNKILLFFINNNLNILLYIYLCLVSILKKIK